MGVIVVLFILGIWVLIDPKISELLKNKSIQLIKIEQILGIELNDSWNMNRYKYVKRVRWCIFFVLIYPNTFLII